MGEIPYDRFKSLFLRAIELPAPEREPFVRQACGDDQALLLAVLDLLHRAENEAPTDANAGRPGGHAQSFDQRTLRPGERPGDVIGRYRLDAVIGEGGFGVVYAARQMDGLDRTVALKLVKPGMDSGQVLARFDAERQALALMDHPNIAKVFDAGVAPSGRPYFVMEYVRGDPIVEYCDKHQLTNPQRLELFAQVCDAVHHAHQKAIIHRDLKPSNILVSIKDDRLHATVIDFGVAKALGRSLTDKTIFTERGQIIGTPQYMSPEQAEMSAVDIDTRSDIYSLGVVLYELLAGAVPLDSKKILSAGWQRMAEVIRESVTPPPHTRLTQLADDPETSRQLAATIAKNRQTDLASLRGMLRQELEWIPLKAIRKDRTHRYRSAAEFADDIRNYLSGRPLTAGPETASYRAKKFVHKHRRQVIAAGLVLVALLVGLVATTVMWSRATRAELRATQNFRQTWQVFSRYITDVNAIESGRAASLADFSDKLRTLIDQAQDQFPPSDPEDQLAMSNALEVLGKSLGGLRSESRGELVEAERAHSESLRIREQLLARDAQDDRYRLATATSLIHIGDLKTMTGRKSEAVAAYERALKLLSEIPAGSPQIEQAHQRESATQTMLSNLYRDAGQLTRAAELARQALEHKRRQAKAMPTAINRRSVTVSLIELADLKALIGAPPADVLAVYEEVLVERDSLWQEQPNDRHSRDLAVAHVLRAAFLHRVGRLDDGLRDVDQARRLLSELQPSDRSRAADTMAEVELVFGSIQWSLFEQCTPADPRADGFRQDAQQALNRALDLVMPGCDKEPTNTRSCHRVARAQLALAKVDLAQGQPISAAQRLEASRQQWRASAERHDDFDAARGFAHASVLLAKLSQQAAGDPKNQAQHDQLLKDPAQYYRDALDALDRSEFAEAINREEDRKLIEEARRGTSAR